MTQGSIDGADASASNFWVNMDAKLQVKVPVVALDSFTCDDVVSFFCQLMRIPSLTEARCPTKCWPGFEVPDNNATVLTQVWAAVTDHCR